MFSQRQIALSDEEKRIVTHVQFDIPRPNVPSAPLEDYEDWFISGRESEAVKNDLKYARQGTKSTTYLSSTTIDDGDDDDNDAINPIFRRLLHPETLLPPGSTSSSSPAASGAPITKSEGDVPDVDLRDLITKDLYTMSLPPPSQLSPPPPPLQDDENDDPNSQALPPIPAQPTLESVQDDPITQTSPPTPEQRRRKSPPPSLPEDNHPSSQASLPPPEQIGFESPRPRFADDDNHNPSSQPSPPSQADQQRPDDDDRPDSPSSTPRPLTMMKNDWRTSAYAPDIDNDVDEVTKLRNEQRRLKNTEELRKKLQGNVNKAKGKEASRHEASPDPKRYTSIDIASSPADERRSTLR